MNTSQEHAGEAGLWRFEQPIGAEGNHLITRDVTTGTDTDRGPLPGTLNVHQTGGHYAGGRVVLYDTDADLLHVVTGSSWVQQPLPASVIACPSLTTDALGCYSDAAVLRVPLNGGPPVVATTGRSPWGMAVTPAVTAWVMVDGTLRSQPASGGAITRSSQDLSVVYNTRPLLSFGDQLVVLRPGDLAQAGLWSTPSAATAPTLQELAGAAPLVASDLGVGGGRVFWYDTYANAYRARTARPEGSVLGLSSTSQALVTGELVDVSGRHTLSRTGIPGDVTGLADYWYDGQLLVGRARQAALSGDRVVYERTDGRLVLRDLPAGTSSLLPVLSHLVFDLSGDRLAYTKADNSVWVRSLSTGSTTQVAPAYSGLGVRIWGSKVAWPTTCCTSTPDLWTWVDVAVPGAPEMGQLLMLSNVGAVVTDEFANGTGPVGIRAYGSADTTWVASNVALPFTSLRNTVGVDAGIAAWIDGSSFQPKAAPTGMTAGRPFALSPVNALRLIDYDGSWTLALKTSAPLTTCSVAITGPGVDRTLGCDEVAMEAGEVLAGGSLGHLPIGPYTWTLTAGNASGAVLDTAGTSWTASGTLYRANIPSITTAAKNTTVLAGKVATFTAAASAVPSPTVQWYRVYPNWSRSAIAGATSTTLRVTATAALQGARYAAVFTNGAYAAETSGVLTVVWPPRVLTHPKTVSARSGATASFSSTATAHPTAKVQWQYSKDVGRTWVNWSGATGTTLKVGASLSRNGWRFKATFSNAYGKAVSYAAVLKVT